MQLLESNLRIACKKALDLSIPYSFFAVHVYHPVCFSLTFLIYNVLLWFSSKAVVGRSHICQVTYTKGVPITRQFKLMFLPMSAETFFRGVETLAATKKYKYCVNVPSTCYIFQ